MAKRKLASLQEYGLTETEQADLSLNDVVLLDILNAIW